jgi:thiaminase
MTQASKDEQIGFHKGALSTLAKEREEMMKILSIVEQLMQMHVKALKELGIDLMAQAENKAAEPAKASATSKLDELVKKRAK